MNKILTSKTIVIAFWIGAALATYGSIFHNDLVFFSGQFIFWLFVLLAGIKTLKKK